jgi:catechol 2,3-dioxygenase-like lactoylglutathione lyase family enzyme
LREDAREGGEWRDTLVFAKLRGQGANSSGLVALDRVHLRCQNLKASRDWYLKVLGIPPIIDTRESVEFRPGGGSRLNLTLATADQTESLGNVAYWRLTDFDFGLKHFLAHGAVVHEPPRYLSSGERICEIKDPFGLVLGLIG